MTNLLKFSIKTSLLLMAMINAASADIITETDKETGLRSWEWRQDGVSFQVTQRLPDQTKAFFIGRGFTAKNAHLIGQACVFQSIFRNDGKQPLDYDLNTWKISHKGNTLPIQTKERWEQTWQTKGAGKAARIALRWSLLPTQQSFEPGDYNWGMTSFGLPPNETFDLSLQITVNGKKVSASIPSITCAAATK